MNIFKHAVIAAMAFTGIAIASTSASALPVGATGSDIAITTTQEARLVCNRFGRCVRVGGYGYRPYRPVYRRGPFRPRPGYGYRRGFYRY